MVNVGKIERARSRARPNARSNVAGVNDCDARFDIVHMNSVLQYKDRAYPVVRQRREFFD